MPRKRSGKNQDLPANLYESGGYYTYRDPGTGQRFTIGKNRGRAIEQANETNRALSIDQRALLERVQTPAPRTIASFIPMFNERLAEKKLATNTLYNRKWQTALIEKELGELAIGARQEDATEITRACSEWLRGIYKAGKQRTAQALRSRLFEIFGEMGSAGWISVNPIAIIKLGGVAVRRQRLTIEDFWKIHKTAGELHTWAQRSLELALVTLQRREDIAEMGFRDQVDGRLQVEQGKTGVRLRIPVSIRLHAVNWSLEEVIKRCRDDVVSRHLLHHGRSQGQAVAGDAVHPQTITGAFREARDLAGIVTQEGKTPSTYHELRSLGARLYRKQGYDPQDLLGHKDPDTTALYVDSRGEWIDVAA